MKKTIIFLFTAILFLIFPYYLSACSAFFLCRNDIKVFARNHDFKTSKGYIRVHRKGVHRKAKLFKKDIKGLVPATWTAKYDSISFHAEEQPSIFIPIDGINSEGLVISELYVNDDNTTIQSFHNTKRSLMCSRWVTYVLDNYKDVNDVIANITNLRLINNFHAHWFICDKKGNSAIIEYINGNLVINYGQPLTIPGLTNHTYQYSCDKLNEFRFMGGEKEIPKGHKSIERFIRGSYELHNFKKGKPIEYMFRLMENIARPTSTDSPTRWITIYNLDNNMIYYINNDTKEPQKIDFDKEIKKENGTIIAKINW